MLYYYITKYRYWCLNFLFIRALSWVLMYIFFLENIYGIKFLQFIELVINDQIIK